MSLFKVKLTPITNQSSLLTIRQTINPILPQPGKIIINGMQYTFNNEKLEINGVEYLVKEVLKIIIAAMKPDKNYSEPTVPPRVYLPGGKYSCPC